MAVAEEYVTAYRRLSEQVHEAGLARRRYGFYVTRLGGWIGGLALLIVAVPLLGTTWLQLVIAILIGVVMAQLGFLSHEAAHRQVFASRERNEWASRVIAGLLMGLSYGWWMDKHNTHHARPNQEGEDPDLDSALLAFTPDTSDRRSRVGEVLSKRQGAFFLPLLLFEGVNLHLAALRTLLTTPGTPHRLLEIGMIIVRHSVGLTWLLVTLPMGMALAFVGVQVATFGLVLGGAFALNHIGMPTVPEGVRLDFLNRQVRMSRNIQDGPFVRFLMGGLQYQIEHHLFPIAPRPALPELKRIVRHECVRLGIPYTELTLREAYKAVVTYLNQVGLKNRDPYRCPLVQRYRG